MSIRHFFNLKHVGRIETVYWAIGVALFMGAAGIATLVKPKAPPPSRASVVSFAEARSVIDRHCVMCHAAAPTHVGITAPPAGVMLDTPENLVRFAPRVYDMAVATRTMPLGNETGMTDLERQRLGAWIKAGARTPCLQAPALAPWAGGC